MRKKINFRIALLMAAVLLCFYFPMTVLAENEYVIEELSAQGEVVSDVNVRKGPGTDYEKIGAVRQGDPLTITGKTSDEWYRIEFQGEEGFVYGQYIRVVRVNSADMEDTVGEQPEDREAQEEETARFGGGVFKAIAVTVIIAVIIVMIILTLRSLRQSEEDEEDEYDEDDEYDDSDDGDEEDAGEEDDDAGDDEEDGNEIKEEQKPKAAPQTIVIREEDYQLHIDPKYFEDEPIAQPECVTGYLQKKQQEEEAARQKEKEGRDNSGDLQKAMDKLQELQEEIEKLKNKQ
ncbi:MAG: SH3 domain-containing protein [Suilimivivens sp.]